MKANIIMAMGIAIALCVSCKTGEKSPVETALSNKMMENNPEIAYLQITEITTANEVLLKDELSRRINLFQKKIGAEEKLINESFAKSNDKKVKEHTLAKDKAVETLANLNSYKEEHQSSLDSLLYYVIKFKASAKMNDGSSVSETVMFATMDKDFNVYNLQKEGGNIYKGMGKAIPGYQDILKDNDAERAVQ